MSPPRSSQRSADGLIRPHGKAVSVVQRALDACLILAALAVPNFVYGRSWSAETTAAVSLAILGHLTVAEVSGLYRSWRSARLRDEITTAITTWLSVVPILLLAAFLTKTTEQFSRIVTSVWLGSVPIALIGLRLAVRSLLRYARRNGRNLRRAAIAGATESGVKIAEILSDSAERGSLVAGVFDDRAAARLTQVDLGQHKLVGRIDDLVEQARVGKVDVVYIAFPLRAERRIKDIIARLADTTATVYVVTDLFVFDLMQARWDTLEGMPVVSVFDTPFHGLGGWVKRTEDLLLASIICVLIALPMLAIALAVKLTSPGPVFFRQTRYGLNGKPIKVLKFRSMTTMDDGPTVRQATKDDARITPLGRILRRTSLDELPQFINVLSGEMSVVGPRPHAVAHNELYRGKIHGYMLRHKVKPGITGWAQINGWRGETEVVEKMEQRIEHDLYYIDNWSLLWDLQIVFWTVFGKSVRKQAY